MQILMCILEVKQGLELLRCSYCCWKYMLSTQWKPWSFLCFSFVFQVLSIWSWETVRVVEDTTVYPPSYSLSASCKFKCVFVALSLWITTDFLNPVSPLAILIEDNFRHILCFTAALIVWMLRLIHTQWVTQNRDERF